MSLIEALWRSLETGAEAGGARRVDEQHPSDLYAALNTRGLPGLILVTGTPIPEPPVFGSVETSLVRRSDGRWSLGLWLRAEPLRPLFARLCMDLIEASRALKPAAVPAFLLSRLMRWRRLLEAGDDGLLSPAELRGLFGELTILRHLLTQWPVGEAVRAWVGPLGAHQDFVLSSTRIEVKTVQPGASTTRISSADQLDVADADLVLAVIALASATADGIGTTPATLVADLRALITDETTLLEFDSLLAAAGYREAEIYDQQFFRVDAVRFYSVGKAFPRITREALPSGVAEVVYDIQLALCEPFRTELRGPGHGA